MASWGIALSRWGNPMAAGNRTADALRRGRAALAAANRHAARATPREQAYIAAVGKLFENAETIDQPTRVAAYEQAMEKLAASEKGDPEAQIFYALSLVAAAPATDKQYTKQRKAGSILEPMWIKQPNHPGLAHYIIHAYDYPPLARDAGRAAHGYAAIAPSTAHALHMPSHIFTRTGSWSESIDTNRRSVDVAMTTRSIAEALHASDYAVYAYLQLGRVDEAKRIVDRLPQLAAVFDPNAVTGAAPGSAGVFALAAIPARYALERDQWAEAAALVPKPSAFFWTEAMTHFARALGAARTGQVAIAKASVDSLATFRDRLAEREPYWSEQVAIQHLGARAWVHLAEGRADSALATMRAAVEREDATEKSAVTPGPLAPARELLGDMLLQLGRPAEALVEYQKTLVVEPNRRRAKAGILKASGKKS
jgi:tetratricopeptide (TPR) repeat protein